MSESFSTIPLQGIIPAYLYQEYSDDENLQAFVAAQNSIAQGFLDWFNATPLAVYTSPGISGPLLDWIGQGIYGIPRPVLSSLTSQMIAGRNSVPINFEAINANELLSSGTATIANDDIYKRVMAWILYRGDGKVFSVRWLKNRVARFLNGPNGSDYAVLNSPPSITVASGVYSITVPNTTAGQYFAQCMSSGVLPLPFQYTYNVTV